MPHHSRPRTRAHAGLRLHAIAATLITGAMPGVVVAQTPASVELRDYDLPAGPLAATLNRIAVESGLVLSVDPAMLEARRSYPVKGRFEAAFALREALRGTGLELVSTPAGTYTLQRLPEPPAGAALLPSVKVEAQADGLFDPLPEKPGFKAEYQESATKTPLSIRETPQSISVVTEDSINARQARDVRSAVELVAGVTSTESFAGGPFAGRSDRNQVEGFSLRGQQLDSTRDVREDGFFSTSLVGSSDLASFERVEVIKGPSSVLYGQGSLGGFINRVRKKPQAETQKSVVAQVGSYDTYRGEVDVTGAFDGPKRYLGRVIGAYEDSGSFVDGVKKQRLVLAPSLSAKLGADTEVLVQVLYTDSDAVPNTGIGPVGGPAFDGAQFRTPRVPRYTYLGVPGANSSDREAIGADVQVDHRFSGDWLASLKLARGHSRSESVLGNSGYVYGPVPGDVYVSSSTNNFDNDTWGGELRIDGKFDALGRGHRILFGIETNHAENEREGGFSSLGYVNLYQDDLPGQFAALGTGPEGGNPLFLFQAGELESRAAYAQLILSPLDRVKIVLGGRYDRARIASSDLRRPGTENERFTESTVTENKPTGRIGATYELTPNVTGYAIYAQSFTPVTATQRGGGILDPETGEGIEGGFKTEWFDQRLGATLSVYQQDRDKVPIPDPTNNPTLQENFSISAGLQRAKGVELEVSGEAFAGLTTGMAVSFQDAEFIDDLDPNKGATPGGTVKRQTNLFASYKFQSGFARGLSLGGTYINYGDRYVYTDAVTGGYKRVDLNFGYSGFKSLDLSLLVRNLFDETYLEGVNGRGLYNYFGSPRAALLRAEYRFD